MSIKPTNRPFGDNIDIVYYHVNQLREQNKRLAEALRACLGWIEARATHQRPKRNYLDVSKQGFAALREIGLRDENDVAQRNREAKQDG